MSGDYVGWTLDGHDREHTESGVKVLRKLGVEVRRPSWEVYSGPLDGARFPSPGLAVFAVEQSLAQAAASEEGE